METVYSNGIFSVRCGNLTDGSEVHDVMVRDQLVAAAPSDTAAFDLCDKLAAAVDECVLGIIPGKPVAEIKGFGARFHIRSQDHYYLTANNCWSAKGDQRGTFSDRDARLALIEAKKWNPSAAMYPE